MSQKTAFVTVGATASFPGLIQHTLSPAFLTALTEHGYTSLNVQYGAGGAELFKSCEGECKSAGSSIQVTGFEIEKSGLGKHMRQVKGGRDAQEGVVISHAGSGTILEALRSSIPIIVVPNTSLLDNHQVELAEVLAEMQYVVHGHLDNLPKALADAEQLRTRSNEWPPPNSGSHRQAKGLKGVIDEEMGFLD